MFLHIYAAATQSVIWQEGMDQRGRAYHEIKAGIIASNQKVL